MKIEYEDILNGRSSDDDDNDDDSLLLIVIAVAVSVTILVVLVIITLYCVRKRHHSKSGKLKITYDTKNGIVEVPDAKFGSERTEKR